MELVVTTRVAAPRFDAAGPGTRADVWAHHLDPGEHPALDLGRARRLVVIGAHPDDESLGAGGLVATARALGVDVDLVCVSDGRGSHPDSPTHTPDDLARRRAGEWGAAAERLGVDADHRHWLGIPDGEVSSYVESVTARLVELVGDGRETVLVAPWREDGHPDHEAAGHAAATAARRTDAELWEYPVWFWHWGRPDDQRSRRLRVLPLPEECVAAKRASIASHISQVEPLSGLAGDEALLSPTVLAHFEGHQEWFLVTPADQCPDQELDRLHGRLPDPWGVDTRWYERRKRSLVLAVLPRPEFTRVLEIGCSTGALTETLASRAKRVVGVDSSATALRAADRRLAGRPDVELTELDVPGQWPEGAFDLIVLSEVGYFLSPAALGGVVDRVRSSLAPDGTIVLCHWRHPVEGWVLDAAQVHAAFEADGLPPLQATYRDRDVEIRVHAAEWPAYDR
jgi:LmbE family N-acetylglucosaminyl deacetylase/SAM-dependent methyltransferase